MAKKTPISFEAAINFVSDKQRDAFAAGQIGRNPGQYLWYQHNFIEFISDLGYHIEITGDEFDPGQMTDQGQ